jgi:AsmA protein
LIITLFPTEWARTRIQGRLSQVTGHPAHVGSLRLGWLGGVQLADLAINQPNSAAGPWLRVSRLRLNLSLLHLLVGRCEPTRVEVEGLALRVHRDRNGKFEFGDLLHAQSPSAAAAATVSGSGTDPCALEITVQDGRVTLIDEPSDTRLEFSAVEGEGSWQRRTAAIKALRGEVNGGHIDIVAQLDHAADSPMFEGQVRTQGVALKGGMGALRYLIPVFASAGESGSLDGRLDLNLYLRGQGSTRAEVRRSVIGHGTIAVDPIRLDGSELVGALADLFELPPRDRIGSVRSQFAIGQGRVTTDRLSLAVGQMPIVLAGWTDFDGHVDYQVRQEGLVSRIPQKARNLLADLPVDLNDLMALHVAGTLDNLNLTLDGTTLDDRSTRHADERMRLREFGRRLRDRILK